MIVALCFSTLGSLICLHYLGLTKAIPVTVNPTQTDNLQACVGPQGLLIAADVIDVGGKDASVRQECKADALLRQNIQHLCGDLMMLFGFQRTGIRQTVRYGPYGWVKGHDGPYGWVKEGPSKHYSTMERG